MSAKVQSVQLSPLGRALKRLRAQQDLTQETLAERVNCSVQTIRFFESGRRRPSWEMAELLADALHVPAAEREEFIRMARLAAPENAPEEEVAAHPSSPSPASPANASTMRLPIPLTPLIGRAAECKLLERMLIDEQRRLVTLVGTGGIGKTRLALHVAQWLADRFPDGAAFVSLSSVHHTLEIPIAIAGALGATLAGNSDPLAQLDALLSQRVLLLVLDNFEHLLSEEGDAAAELISHVVQRDSGVQFLVTSTERLRISAESIVELGGLTAAAPDAASGISSDAVMLYVERARQVSSDFALTPDNRAAVERICTLLEGMPLGLELAASWARMLTADEIAAEIERGLDFLTLADRSAPARHRSLRAVFDYTWRLMTPEEQRILPRLAIFRGGFDRTAALEVAGATLLQLAALLDKSVLRVAEEAVADGKQSIRYSLHGLLRQFLLEKLEASGELEAIQRAHARTYTELAERAYPNLFGKDTAGWQRVLDQDQGNLNAALVWSLNEGHDPALGLRLAGALSRTWRLGGVWRQGRAWLELALAQPAGNAVERARALVGVGECCHALSDHEAARRYLAEGLALWQQIGEPRWIAWTLFQKGMLDSSLGHTEEAIEQLEASLALYRQMGDLWGVATVLNQLGATVITIGDYARGMIYLDESIPLMRSLGQGRTGLAVSLNALGRIVLAQGNAERAIALFEEARSIFAQRNIREGVAWSYINLGLARLEVEDFDAAQDDLCTCLDLYLELDMMIGITASLNALAVAAAGQRRYADALRLSGVVERLCREHDLHFTEYELQIRDRTLAQLRAVVTDVAFTKYYAEGEMLSLSRAVALARDSLSD
ncbi:MAG: tetratricopeptide repeat protein [Caldilinea sp.]|nr:tetratricopeptide repeat protein [Caldilinea sp.]